MDAECKHCSFKDYLQSPDPNETNHDDTGSHDEHGHGDSGVELHIGHKVAALFFMAGITIVAALIPIYVRQKISSSSCRKWKEAIMSTLLCFAAGNLIGVAFIHLLPHTREYVQEATEHHILPEMEFPLAEVLMCIGFFFIYVIEDIVHGCVGHHHHNDEDMDMIKASGTSDEVGKDTERSTCENTCNETDEDVCKYDPEPKLMKGVHTTAINAVTMVAAISICDNLEGFSIGLADKVEDVWLLTVVFVIHKLILAFSIGMELLQEGLKLIPYLAAMVTFALATPIGGAIGIASLSFKGESAFAIMLPALLNGLSGGCILFVVFCEMIERERRRLNGSWVRIVSIMFGFALIAGLELLPHHAGHSHGHGHSHHGH